MGAVKGFQMQESSGFRWSLVEGKGPKALRPHWRVALRPESQHRPSRRGGSSARRGGSVRGSSARRGGSVRGSSARRGGSVRGSSAKRPPLPCLGGRLQRGTLSSECSELLWDRSSVRLCLGESRRETQRHESASQNSGQLLPGAMNMARRAVRRPGTQRCP